MPEAPGPLMVLRAYVGLGVEHILFGIDHLLFVLCLLLLVRRLRQLLATITAFTLAHSITLAAATLGFIRVPTAPVEATIALSIVFLASELVRDEGRRGVVARYYPWLVAFSFGLLHGLGFAGALAEVGLPQGEIPLALFAFNVGVELGQLAFVTAVLTFGASRSSPTAAPPGLGTGGGWVCDRVVGCVLGVRPTRGCVLSLGAAIISVCFFCATTVIGKPAEEGRLSTCAVTRRRFSSGCKPRPATAPAGSNRSRHGGDEVSEAFG